MSRKLLLDSPFRHLTSTGNPFRLFEALAFNMLQSLKYIFLWKFNITKVTRPLTRISLKGSFTATVK